MTAKKNLKLKFCVLELWSTQSDAAHEIGISDWTLSRLICGRAVPSKKHRAKLEAALGAVECAEFFDGGES